ncbi:hypothetical protein [Aeromicrobium sp. UC242_57]|uniref:hypothetical protein n=1 Tax=Aeromicrobium sp. UC242_57 TaxID=3374624 RepID=UPI003798AC00
MNELSSRQRDPTADVGSGARRSSISLTAGFVMGPAAAGLLAQWSPHPLVVPYLVHMAIAVPATVLLAAHGVETRTVDGRLRLRDAIRAPGLSHRRFRWVVVPMAPWIFGSAGIAYAIVPQQVDAAIGSWGLLFATGLTVLTLGTGLAVQPLAKRLDDTSSARAVVVSMGLMALGVVAAAGTAATGWPVMALPTAVLLGAAYGIAVVSGLLEIRRMATPQELAGMVGVYYALAYVGFLAPAVLAGMSTWFSYPVMLSVLVCVALLSTIVIASAYRKHLPGETAVDLFQVGR